MTSNTLFLLGTAGCHLCEEAEKLLIHIPNSFSVLDVDIAEHAEYYNSYALKIPVLYHPVSGCCLCWPFETSDIDDFIKAIPDE